MEVHTINSNLMKKFAVVLFVLLSLWWIFVAFILKNTLVSVNLLWAAFYQLMALFGAVCGLIIFKRWSGFKSVMGKAIILFSVGLLLQVFGQSVFSFYNLFLKVEVPYPSFADIGFFFSIPFYIYGAILLGKASGAYLSLKSFYKKIQVVIIPVVILIASYVVFLRGYQFNWSAPLTVFLDFGYPLGQAVYVSITLLVFILSRDFFGGIMRPKIRMFLLALIVQYVADYNFLYQASKLTWVNGGYGDYIYLVAYFTMAVALIELDSVFGKIKTQVQSMDNRALSPQLALRIIKVQELIIGPMAWEEAKSVEGLTVDLSHKSVSFIGDERDVIDRLVAQYEKLFGKESRVICKEGVQDLIAKMSPEEIPDSLK